MTVQEAYAKINLHLAVLAREETGYHQIETLFCAIELADRLEVALAGDDIRVDVEGAELGAMETNLAYRAAAAFFERARLPPSARIRLEKRIPAGAGLGGGSSDAAVTLLALNGLHRQPLTNAELFEIASSLGSDVPFFLAREPLALAWGRGHRLLPLPPLPVAHVLLVVPSVRMNTADAYHALADTRDAAGPPIVPAVLTRHALQSFRSIARFAYNDFEPIAFATFPQLRDLHATLAHSGAAHSMMTGSGSAFFAIFHREADARRAAEIVRERHSGADTLVTRTCTNLPALAVR